MFEDAKSLKKVLEGAVEPTAVRALRGGAVRFPGAANAVKPQPGPAKVERLPFPITAPENSEQLSALLNSSPIGVAVVSMRTNKRLFVNSRMVDLFAAESADDLLHRDIEETWVNPRELIHVRNLLARGEDICDFEAERRRYDGTKWWVLLNSHRVDYLGEPARVIWHHDITDRINAERQLRDGKRRLEIENAEKNAAERALREINTHLEKMIDERTAEIRLARDEAENASRAKSHFLANMSHELRTPLNAIIGFSDVIASEALGSVGNKVYLDYVRDISRSGGHLLDIINELLDISRLEAGKVELDEAPISVLTLFGDAVRMTAQHAQERGVEIKIDVPDGYPFLNVDELRLRQVVLNLLSNAVKFTPDGGKICLNARLTDGGAPALQVKDTGIGIPEHDLSRVLEPFSQVEDSLSRSNHGTGLGLSLSKGLVELHGGTLDIESELGIGTLITIHLPKSRLCDA